MIEIGKEYIFNYRARKTDAPDDAELCLSNNGNRCRVIDIRGSDNTIYEVEAVCSGSEFFAYEDELNELEGSKKYIKPKAFTEEDIWKAIKQASVNCFDDCEYSGVLSLAEVILGIPYNQIKRKLEYEENTDTIKIGVYRDTFEDFWNNPNMGNNNIADIVVSVDFAKQYWKENQAEHYKTFEDFYCNHTCDDTEDFYQYASEQDAILDIERW